MRTVLTAVWVLAAALVGRAASLGNSASSLLFIFFVFVFDVLVESLNH